MDGVNWQAVNQGFPQQAIYGLGTDNRYVFASIGTGPSTPTLYRRLISDFGSVGIRSVAVAPKDFLFQANRFSGAAFSFRMFMPTIAETKIHVFTVAGKKIDEIRPGRQSAGWHGFQWVARGGNGVLIVRAEFNGAAEGRVKSLMVPAW